MASGGCEGEQPENLYEAEDSLAAPAPVPIIEIVACI